MKINRSTLKQEAKELSTITGGLILYAFGWTGFLLPSEITTGGVTGIAALTFYATKIPVAVTYLAINGVLLALSIKIFGLKFSLRTIFGVAVLTFLLSFFQLIITKPLVASEPFMNCILGGVLCGAGIGLVFSGKGSTGGTDIIALIINKYKDLTIGKGMLACDVLIICSSYVVFQSVEKIVYGLVVMGVTSYSVDLVLNGTRQSVQFLIFSNKYEEIANKINLEIHRGCTILDGTGWYSKKSNKVVVVLARKVESAAIFRLVKSIDPDAFVSQSLVIGVFGQGFDKIKG